MKRTAEDVGLDEDAADNQPLTIVHTLNGVSVTRSRAEWKALGFQMGMELMGDKCRRMEFSQFPAFKQTWADVLNGRPIQRDFLEAFLVRSYLALGTVTETVYSPNPEFPEPSVTIIDATKDLLAASYAYLRTVWSEHPPEDTTPDDMPRLFWDHWRLWGEHHSRYSADLQITQCFTDALALMSNWKFSPLVRHIVVDAILEVDPLVRQAVHLALEQRFMAHTPDYPVVTLNPTAPRNREVRAVLKALARRKRAQFVLTGSAAYHEYHARDLPFGSDIDLFIYGESDVARKESFRVVLSTLCSLHPKARVTLNPGVATVIVPGWQHYVQVVFTDAQSPTQVIGAFDLGVCRFTSHVCSIAADLAHRSGVMVVPHIDVPKAGMRAQKWSAYSGFRTEPKQTTKVRDPKALKVYYPPHDDPNEKHTDVVIAALRNASKIYRTFDDAIKDFEFIAMGSGRSYLHTDVVLVDVNDTVDFAPLLEGVTSRPYHDVIHLFEHVSFVIDTPHCNLYNFNLNASEIFLAADQGLEWRFFEKIEPLDAALRRIAGMPPLGVNGFKWNFSVRWYQDTVFLVDDVPITPEELSNTRLGGATARAQIRPHYIMAGKMVWSAVEVRIYPRRHPHSTLLVFRE